MKRLLTLLSVLIVVLIFVIVFISPQKTTVQPEAAPRDAPPSIHSVTFGAPDVLRLKEETVCIVMFGTSDIMRQYGDIAVAINRAYAEYHGYALIVWEASSMDRTEAVWKTVDVIRRHLPSYKAVMWIDCDAVFNPIQHETSLDWFLKSREDALVCRDIPPREHDVNAGVMLFKNTQWSRDFLDRWWEMRTRPQYQDGFREQAALNDLLRKKENSWHFSIRKSGEFNYIPDDEDRKGAFVIHLAGTDCEYRKKVLGELYSIMQ